MPSDNKYRLRENSMEYRHGSSESQHKKMIQFYYFCAILMFIVIMTIVTKTADPIIDSAIEKNTTNQVEASSSKEDLSLSEKKVETTQNSNQKSTIKASFTFKVKAIGYSIVGLILAVGMCFIGVEEVGLPLVGGIILFLVILLLFF